MSEANNGAGLAVAEAEEKTPVTTPQSEETETNTTPDGAGEGAEGSAPPATQDEGTAGSEDFDSIFEQELKAELGEESAPTPSEPTPTVGTPTEEWEATRRAQLAQKHVSARQGGETWVKQQAQRLFPDATDEQINSLWETTVKPWGSDIITTADDFLQDFDNRLIDTLSEDQKKIWNKTKHNNRTEFRDKFIDLGRQEVEAKYQADIKAGKLFTSDMKEKIETAAKRAGRAQAEALAKKHGFELGKDGNRIATEAPQSGRAYHTLTTEQRNEIKANGPDAVDAYIAKHGA